MPTMGAALQVCERLGQGCLRSIAQSMLLGPFRSAHHTGCLIGVRGRLAGLYAYEGLGCDRRPGSGSLLLGLRRMRLPDRV